jgi:uncharacterized damage-inducible protein DinB
MRLKSIAALVLMTFALTAVARAQSPDTTAPTFKSFYNYSKQNILGSAEKMPAEHFSFKPTPEVRTYAAIFGHIMNTNYPACAALKGEANPNKADFEQTAKTKEEVVKALKASFDYCDEALKNVTDATFKETFKSGARDVPKTSPFMLIVAHNFEHYGNLVTYMRLKGIVPPSSEPPPQKK